MRTATRVAGAVATLSAIVFVAAPAAQAATRTGQVPAAARASSPGTVSATAAELMNAATGAALWGKNASVQKPMGSITKVMTAYLVIKAGTLSRAITVPAGITAYDKGASTAGLVPGEKYSTLQLLYALMLPSGCDAAYTLATAYGGRVTFIKRMNSTAKNLGLAHTHFTDFSGLPKPTGTSTYSTARDLVVLGRDAMKLPLLAHIVAQRTYKFATTSWHHGHTWANLNPLLGHYSGADGIKTGQTNAAGACLLFEAVRGGKTLIGVVLHSAASLSTASSDAQKVLNWGFAQ